MSDHVAEGQFGFGRACRTIQHALRPSGGAIGEQPRGLHRHRHVGQHELYALEFGDCPPNC